jgi:hypothetical protein
MIIRFESLKNPYDQPTLHIRKPESDVVQVISFETDDPSFNEVSLAHVRYTCFLTRISTKLSTWIDNVDEYPHAKPILSSYEGAFTKAGLLFA